MFAVGDAGTWKGVSIWNESTVNGVNALLRFRTATYDTLLVNIYEGSSNDGRFSIMSDVDATGMAEHLTIASTGYVGIGTTNPGAKLHVYGSSGNELLRLASDSITGSPFISFYQTTTRRSFIEQNDSNDALNIVSEYGDVVIKGASTPGSNTAIETVRFTGDNGITFAVPVTGSSAYFSGNVGIGTNAPESGLHIKGAYPTGYLTVERTGLNGLGPGGVAALKTDAKTVGDAIAFTFQALDSTDATQTYAQLRMEIVDPTAGSEDSKLSFWTNNAGTNTQQVTISETGNVGIGTTNPVDLLHVYGTTDPTVKIQSNGTDEISGRLSLRQSNETGMDIFYDGTGGNERMVFNGYSAGVSTGEHISIKQ